MIPYFKKTCLVAISKNSILGCPVWIIYPSLNLTDFALYYLNFPETITSHPLAFFDNIFFITPRAAVLTGIPSKSFFFMNSACSWALTPLWLTFLAVSFKVKSESLTKLNLYSIKPLSSLILIPDWVVGSINSSNLLTKTLTSVKFFVKLTSNPEYPKSASDFCKSWLTSALKTPSATNFLYVDNLFLYIFV